MRYMAFRKHLNVSKEHLLNGKYQIIYYDGNHYGVKQGRRVYGGDDVTALHEIFHVVRCTFSRGS